MSDDLPLTVQLIIQTLSTPPVSLPMRKAMEAAKILVPTKLIALSLSNFNEKALKELGIKEAETRKAIKAGWPKVVQGKGKNKEIKVGPPSPPKKRKRSSGRSDMFEIHDPEGETSSSSSAIDLSVPQLDFGETIPEEKLLKASVTANRAPVMTAWSTVVCLRLGFSKEEALSLASVYTEMNATSRAISLGKQLAPKRPTLEDELRKPENTQPYVDLMGRRIPVVAKEDETWRAVRESGEICKPGRAASYLLSSFPSSNHLPIVLRSLTLLAESHSAAYLQTDQGGFGLYMLFRPNPPPIPIPAEFDGAEGGGKGKGKEVMEMQWGGKGLLKMEEILSLRGLEVRKEEEEEEEEEVGVKEEEGEEEEEEEETEKHGPSKRPRRASTTSARKKIVYKEEEIDDLDEEEEQGEVVVPKKEEEDEDEMFWGDLKDEDLPVDI